MQHARVPNALANPIADAVADGFTDTGAHAFADACAHTRADTYANAFANTSTTRLCDRQLELLECVHAALRKWRTESLARCRSRASPWRNCLPTKSPRGAQLQHWTMS